MHDTHTPLGRPPAAPFHLVGSALPNACQVGNSRFGIRFSLWPLVVERSSTWWRDVLEGRGRATFETLRDIRRIGIICDVRRSSVTRLDLPDIPLDVTRSDLNRLHELRPTPWVKAFVDRRLQELTTGEVINRLNAFCHPSEWTLAKPREEGDV